MADHIRTQIRDALITRLTGLATTGSNVFKTVTHDIPDSDLPCLEIRNGPEQSEIKSLQDPVMLGRTFTIEVRVIAKASADVDDLADTITAEVEKAIAADDSLGGLISGGLWLVSTEPDITGTQERPLAIITMNWQVTYHCLQTAPDSAI